MYLVPEDLTAIAQIFGIKLAISIEDKNGNSTALISTGSSADKNETAICLGIDISDKKYEILVLSLK